MESQKQNEIPRAPGLPGAIGRDVGSNDPSDPVTLEQLRVFVAVAERQHVTRAAEALHLAQSAVSAAIAALEGRHGTKLFHRVGRGIELTEAGRLFLDEARAVLGRAEMAEAMLVDLSGLRLGTLLVHASQTIAGYWLPRRLADFRRRHPAVDVKLTIGNTAEAAKAVREGAAEIGLVEGEIDEPMLEVSEVARDQLIVLVGADHPWCQRDRLEDQDLHAIDWVLREKGSGTRSALEAALRLRGLDVVAMKIALELPSNEAVRGAVEAGLGVTALSASVAVASLEAGLLYHVPFELPARAFSLIRHRERHRSAGADAFLRQLGLEA